MSIVPYNESGCNYKYNNSYHLSNSQTGFEKEKLESKENLLRDSVISKIVKNKKEFILDKNESSENCKELPEDMKILVASYQNDLPEKNAWLRVSKEWNNAVKKSQWLEIGKELKIPSLCNQEKVKDFIQCIKNEIQTRWMGLGFKKSLCDELIYLIDTCICTEEINLLQLICKARNLFIIGKVLQELIPNAISINLDFQNFNSVEEIIDTVDVFVDWCNNNQYSLSLVTRLDLKKKQLTSLPGEILQFFPKLQSLDLYGNKLSSLPSELVQLKELISLRLSKNNFSSLPVELGQLKKLKHLILSHNNLAAFPSEILQLKNLTHLFLNDNNLTSLPTEIRKLAKLVELVFSQNNLTSLPVEIGQLVNLQSLKLDENNLTSFPIEVLQLANLQKLDFSNNGWWISVPDGFWESHLVKLTKGIRPYPSENTKAAVRLAVKMAVGTIFASIVVGLSHNFRG